MFKQIESNPVASQIYAGALKFLSWLKCQDMVQLRPFL